MSSSTTKASPRSPATFLVAGILVACNGSSTPTAQPTAHPVPAADAQPRATVPLCEDVTVQHFLTLPVSVGDQATIAILDTGIGLALISKAMCARIGCRIEGEFTGRRMSGQAVTIPTTTLDVLEVGGIRERNVPAGVVDIEGFFPDPRVEAFVGLPFFERTPFTLDLAARRLVIESAASLAAREREATVVPVRLDRQGIALDIFAPAVLPDGTELEVLMDTGSHGVTLHTRYADPLGIDFDSGSATRRDGQDETGQAYTRWFTTLESLAFARAPTARRTGLRVMFQEIIHDGLVGTEFLGGFVITYDLPRERVLVR